jgi:hypothetical protein
VTDGDNHCAACPVDSFTGFVLFVRCLRMCGAASGCVLSILLLCCTSVRYLDSVRCACSVLMGFKAD